MLVLWCSSSNSAVEFKSRISPVFCSVIHNKDDLALREEEQAALKPVCIHWLSALLLKLKQGFILKGDIRFEMLIKLKQVRSSALT